MRRRPRSVYHGLFGRTARRRCPHSDLQGVYGDEVRAAGWYRLWCRACHRFVDGPVSLAQSRERENDGVA
jgi:hypothetical protein